MGTINNPPDISLKLTFSPSLSFVFNKSIRTETICSKSKFDNIFQETLSTIFSFNPKVNVISLLP